MIQVKVRKEKIPERPSEIVHKAVQDNGRHGVGSGSSVVSTTLIFFFSPKDEGTGLTCVCHRRTNSGEITERERSKGLQVTGSARAYLRVVTAAFEMLLLLSTILSQQI